MPRLRTPKGVLKRMNEVTKAWEAVRPAKSFAGFTLDQYKEIQKPSIEAREKIAELEGLLQAAIARRDEADVAAMETTNLIIKAVRGDPAEGENGELYAALGYVRQRMRSSGLTRRRGNGEMKPQGGTS